MQARFLPVFLLLAAALSGQDLRKALADADLVVVARQVGSKEIGGGEVVLHRLQVLQVVRGTAELAVVTVLDWPRLSRHHRPMPRQSRLYCLQDAGPRAERLGLPADGGPYCTMSGWAGSNPLVGADLGADPVVAFARVLAAAEQGTATEKTAAALAEVAIGGAATVRREAAALLAERPDLRRQLGSVHWSRLVAKATAETDDIPYKVALCELAAEQRVPGLLEGMLAGLESVPDPEFARAVGRLAAAMHGEAGAGPLLQRLRQTPGPEARAALLLALGATSTDAALEALLQLQRTLGADAAVTAALREHASPKAREAAHRGGR